mmetsp:Transcript_9232/g.22679  ORF Transcript_9232/g.22679 Transcript_9232/m.22679 type:complete len:88 (+) Transcript_9232:48-311(+)
MKVARQPDPWFSYSIKNIYFLLFFIQNLRRKYNSKQDPSSVRFYLFVNRRPAMPAATPTAAATVTPPIAASLIFRLSACSIDSMLER